MKVLGSYLKCFQKPMISKELTKTKVLSALLALAFVLGACGASSLPESGAPTTEPAALAISDDGPTLRNLAAQRGLKIGSAVSLAGIDDIIPTYMELLHRHFSLVVPENGGYMSDIRPSPDHWDFWGLDRVVAAAKESGQQVRGHTLIFGIPSGHDMFGGGWTPTPAWVHEKEMSREEAIAVMQEYIETVMQRYAGTIDEWIVVNEPLGSQFGARRVNGVLLAPNVWFEKIGPDYIQLAFEHARRVDPDAKLIINDWGADFLGQDYHQHDRVGEYYRLVAYLIEQGTPIDGVGFQFHLEVGLDYPRVRAIVENFERYAALGLSTHITELDVRLRKPVTAAGLKRQAALFGNVFAAALASPSTEDVVLWGFTDLYSWITAGISFRGYGTGTIMNRDLRPYPSFEAIRKRLAARQSDS